MFTRREFVGGVVMGAAGVATQNLFAATSHRLTLPTAQQVEWSEQELGMFFHMDIPIFQQAATGENVEHHKGWLDPNIYNPAKLDTDQWMEAAKAMGAKYVVFVAVHGTGFLQWQSNAYEYSLKQAVWRGGKGDVVKSFFASARKYGLKPGLYAYARGGNFLNAKVPVQRADGTIDMAAQKLKSSYIEKYLTELWRDNGELFEIWFDGGVLPVAQGGPDVNALIAKYQPQANVFQGPANMRNLVRWVGNERAVAPYPCWSTGFSITSSDGMKETRFPGHPDGNIWAPGECDVPLRNHKWFWTDEKKPHPGWRYWTDEELIDKYYTSVGRNCNMLLNANINADGLVPEEDFGYYKRFGENIRARFANPLAQADATELKFAQPTEINQVAFGEDIAKGQRIRKYALSATLPDGTTKELCVGSSVGHKRIERFERIAVKALKLVIQEEAAPSIVKNFTAWNVKA